MSWLRKVLLLSLGVMILVRGVKVIVPPRNLTENCPRMCFCSKTLTSVNCEGKGLTVLPSGIPTKVTKLYLGYNKLTTIPSGSFKDFLSLDYLDLRSNKMTSLQENAFKGASALSNLYLTTNLIEKIDPQAFDGLLNLQFLQLGENKMANMFSLGYIPNLQKLVLQGNSFQSITFPDDAESLRSLNDVVLSSNKISNLSGLSFQALKNSGLRRLDLAKNNIEYIPADAFLPLTKLQSLELGENHLTPKALRTAFSGIRSNELASLDISAVSFDGTLDPLLFEPFENVTLRNLKINQNSIHEIASDSFLYLKHLITLDLTGCGLRTIATTAFEGQSSLHQLRLGTNGLKEIPRNLPPSLQKLYLDNNSILALEDGDFFGLKGLQELYLGANSIHTLEQKAFDGLSNLRKLHLVANKIATLPGDVFKPLQQLISLELNKNNLQRIPSEIEVFSVMSSLRYLNLADNFCKQIPLNLFQGMTDLQYLHLENNVLGSIVESDYQGNLFRGLNKLQELYLTNNQITSLPESIFKSLTSAIIINVRDNRISQWDKSIFSVTDKLETLDISNNLITTLNKTLLKDLMKLKNLNLTGNPFSCNCDLRWFRDWLNKTTVQVTTPEKYKCNSPPDWAGRTLLSFNKNQIDCTNWTPFYISGGVGGGVLVTLVLLIVMYRYRWFVKLRWHRACVTVQSMTRKRRGYEELQGENKQFDAYISYSEADKRWVVDYLLPTFDNRDMGGQQFGGNFRLCLDDRDFIPGEVEVGNIDSCMRNSRKILIVLSRSYLREGRCEFELRHAFHMANVEQDVEELLLIKKGRLRTKDIPKILSTMMAKREFVEWPEDDDDEDGRDNFVQQLNTKIAHRKPPTVLEI